MNTRQGPPDSFKKVLIEKNSSPAISWWAVDGAGPVSIGSPSINSRRLSSGHDRQSSYVNFPLFSERGKGMRVSFRLVSGNRHRAGAFFNFRCPTLRRRLAPCQLYFADPIRRQFETRCLGQLRHAVLFPAGDVRNKYFGKIERLVFFR